MLKAGNVVLFKVLNCTLFYLPWGNLYAYGLRRRSQQRTPAQLLEKTQLVLKIIRTFSFTTPVNSLMAHEGWQIIEFSDPSDEYFLFGPTSAAGPAVASRSQQRVTLGCRRDHYKNR